MNDRLYRSATDRVFSGLCGGMAEYFDLDPSLVRLAWVVLDVLTGIFPLLVVYVVMAMVVPEEPPEGAQPWPGWGPQWGPTDPAAQGTAAPGAPDPAASRSAAAGATGAAGTSGAWGSDAGSAAGAGAPGAEAPGGAHTDASNPGQGPGTWAGWGPPPPPNADWRSARAYWRGRRRAQRAYWRSQRRGGDASAAGLVFGVILVLVGVLFLLHDAVPSFDTSLLWPAILIVLGAALLAGAFRR